MQVPFLDLTAQHRHVKDEILNLWREVLDTGCFIGGSHIAALEQEFAAACHCKHALAVSSGTDALMLIFEALGLRPGDEVIVPVNTFIATSEAVSKAGGKVVFVDILPDTYNMDPAAAEAAVTSRTVGIVPVHLYGQMADMDPLMAVAKRHGLWVVEDSAQAHLSEYKGRKAGSMGVAAGFSFYPGKNMGACGDAGAVVTNDSALAEHVAKLRDHGSAKKYHHDFEGYNGRCDALQAAALRVKLSRLPDWNEARRRVAAKYIERLADAEAIVLPHVPDHCLPVWHLFVIQVDKRNGVQECLTKNGIGSGLHYPVPLHMQKAYEHLGLQRGTYPVTEDYTTRLLSLPMFPEMTDNQIDYVCKHLKLATAG